MEAATDEGGDNDDDDEDDDEVAVGGGFDVDGDVNDDFNLRQHEIRRWHNCFIVRGADAADHGNDDGGGGEGGAEDTNRRRQTAHSGSDNRWWLYMVWCSLVSGR